MGWIGEWGEVMGEARVRAKLGREADGQMLSLSSSGSSDEARCCFVVVKGGMTRRRVGARPRPTSLNSCAVMRSPDALIRPEEKTTPDARSANANANGASSSLSARETLSKEEEDCEAQEEVSGVSWCSPRVTWRRGDSDSGAHWVGETVRLESVGELEDADGGTHAVVQAYVQIRFQMCFQVLHSGVVTVVKKARNVGVGVTHWHGLRRIGLGIFAAVANDSMHFRRLRIHHDHGH